MRSYCKGQVIRCTHAAIPLVNSRWDRAVPALITSGRTEAGMPCGKT